MPQPQLQRDAQTAHVAAPAPTAATSAATDADAAVGTYQVSIHSGFLNLRSTPDQSASNVIDHLPQHASVQVVDPHAANGFFHVKWNAATGWASGRYLTLQSAANRVVQAMVQPPAPKVNVAAIAAATTTHAATEVTRPTNMPAPTSPGTPPPAPAHVATGVLYLGMNKDSPQEARTLVHGAPQDHVTEIDKVNLKGVFTDASGTHDLTKPDGVHAFASSLDCTPAQRQAVEHMFGSVVGGGSRDEVRQLVIAYAHADATGSGMHRVVLSGHGDADNLSGDNGDVSFAVLEALAKIFPRAAAQVDHLMISSCYSAGSTAMDSIDPKAKPDPDAPVNYHTMFPNLKTILAYSGSSPSIATGSTAHMSRWEKATTKADVKTMDPEMMDGLRYGENVSSWDTAGGYHTQSDAEDDGARSFMEILHRDDAMIAAYVAGDKECADPHSGELKIHYDYLQKALGNKSVTGDDRAYVRQQIPVVLRLRYYPEIRRHFAETYGGEITAGYAAIHRPGANFGALSRKAALAEIAQFTAAQHGSSDPAAKRCGELLSDFQQLNPTLLPLSWVT